MLCAVATCIRHADRNATYDLEITLGTGAATVIAGFTVRVTIGFMALLRDLSPLSLAGKQRKLSRYDRWRRFHSGSASVRAAGVGDHQCNTMPTATARAFASSDEPIPRSPRLISQRSGSGMQERVGDESLPARHSFVRARRSAC
jgi:ABC-type taurine transport system substrate-binding protein